MVPIDKDGRCNVIIRWDSNTERKHYWDNLYPGTLASPKVYNIVVIKPEPILLGDTAKAPKYYPDFLVQFHNGTWAIDEVKGAVESPVWRKVRMLLADRIESGKFVSYFNGAVIHPHLRIYRYIKREWQVEKIWKPVQKGVKA